MTEIISHPGKPLIVHLREVARFCAKTIESKSLGLTVDKGVLQKLGFIQGAVHDIGKATNNFQIYIKSNGEIINKPKHHALISAYLAKEIAKDFLVNTELSPFDKAILPYFIFTAVKRHHGSVKNFDFELESLREKESDLKILRENFYDEEVQLILDDLLAEIDIKYNWGNFKTYMNDLDNVFEEIADFSIEFMKYEFEELSEIKKAEYFYLHHLFFSTLLLSDKTDVKLGEDKIFRSSHFNFNAIEAFREEKGFNNPTSSINELKNQAYFEGLENLKKKFNPGQHLYSITLPTGLGKTITSLAVAMEIKKIMSDQNPRIIITIPFTSIIDQNYNVFNEIFDSPASNVLLKHHHLAEPKYKLEEDTLVEKNVEASKFLIETWQSEIIVTTFVQLLEGIFTNNKGKLLKLPNLMNSIIILDEIQQIKYELWELIRTAFIVLGKRFNCYFILMSATQPLIFEPEKEIFEIIPNHQQYFRFFNRTQLINKTQNLIALKSFVEIVIEHYHNNPDKSILIVLNTKKITLECFKQIINEIPKEHANLYFLTTLITPYERKQIINLIKNPPNGLPNIIVSTQLIEAGVDISVHTVFRALAPLDSIIQAAGRANRYFENKNSSAVYLYRIEELERSTNMLYGSDLILKTVNVLANIEKIQESNYLNLIQAYFKEVRKQSDNLLSDELRALQKLKFEDLGKFKFIPYRKTESLFVQLNEAAKEVWEKYIAIYKSPDLSIFQKREAFALIKANFYDFVINIPVPYDREAISFDSEPIMHFYLSEMENPSNCYSYNPNDFRNNTGYKEVETVSY